MYQTLGSYAVDSGAEILFCYVNDVTGGVFMNFLYVGIFIVMALGSFFITKKATGSGDFPVSMAVGSWTALIFSVLMKIIDCPNRPLTDDVALAVIIGLTFLSMLFLFFSRD